MPPKLTVVPLIKLLPVMVRVKAGPPTVALSAERMLVVGNGLFIVKMRAGVKAYNAKNHVPDGPTSGYNETTTHAFLHLIAATIRAYDNVLRSPDADAFCNAHPQLMTRHALRLFYSPQQRMHPLAKQQFVEPDLAPLPRIR